MPFDKFIDIDNINEARRKAVAKSIRTISVEELKKLGTKFSIHRIIRGGKSSFN